MTQVQKNVLIYHRNTSLLKVVTDKRNQYFERNRWVGGFHASLHPLTVLVNPVSNMPGVKLTLALWLAIISSVQTEEVFLKIDKNLPIPPSLDCNAALQKLKVRHWRTLWISRSSTTWSHHPKSFPLVILGTILNFGPSSYWAIASMDQDHLGDSTQLDWVCQRCQWNRSIQGCPCDLSRWTFDQSSSARRLWHSRQTGPSQELVFDRSNGSKSRSAPTWVRWFLEQFSDFSMSFMLSLSMLFVVKN